MRLNWVELKRAIKADSRLLREMKEKFRQTGYEMSAADSRSFRMEKAEATIHHSIAAHCRGRLHITKSWNEHDKCFYPRTTEHQLKLIEKSLPKFLLPEEPEQQQAVTA